MNKIVLKREIEGDEIIVRYPTIVDADAMHTYINSLSKEKTFVTWQGETISLFEEKQYLENQIKKIQNKRAITLLLFVNSELAGVSDINLLERVQSHVGHFGISIAHSVRGKGLGKLLMKSVLEESRNMKDLKIITLEVFANNEKAIHLYQSFGFKEYGRLPGGIKYKETFIENVLMYKQL